MSDFRESLRFIRLWTRLIESIWVIFLLLVIVFPCWSCSRTCEAICSAGGLNIVNLLLVFYQQDALCKPYNIVIFTTSQRSLWKIILFCVVPSLRAQEKYCIPDSNPRTRQESITFMLFEAAIMFFSKMEMRWRGRFTLRGVYALSFKLRCCRATLRLTI